LKKTDIEKTKKQISKGQRKKPLTFAVIAIVLILLLYLLFNLSGIPSDKKIKTDADKPQKRPLSVFEMEKRDVTGKLPGQKSRDDNIERPVIKAIKFIPEQPTIFDNIKAEITISYSGEGKVTYEYLWKINNIAVNDIKGDTLPSGTFKKKDKISVRVTPYADGIEGYPYESMFIVIHSAPPSLELKETVQKISDTIEFQLISIDPDGDKVTFSLEDPYLEGMTINKETGKIIYKPLKKEKGVYKFRASATDTDGAKITKTFEFKID
jgi:hypothetical protein